MKTIYSKGNCSYNVASSDEEYEAYKKKCETFVEEFRKKGYGGPLCVKDTAISVKPEPRNNDTYYASLEGPTINGQGFVYCGPDTNIYVIKPGTLNTGIKESKTSKNMKKNVIKLNEAQLRKIVSESVKKVLREVETIDGGDMMGMWDGPMDGPTNDGMGYDDWLLSDEGLTEIKKKLIEVYGYGNEEFWTWDDAREIAKIVLSDDVSIDDAMKQYVLDEYDITAPEATENTVKMNESQLRKLVAESVKRVLRESTEEEAMNLYKELCQSIGVKNIDDIEIKPMFQLGKAYLIFNDKFSESGWDLKRFAKDFIHKNNLNNDYIFDIKGFSNDHTLWVEVFRKNF